MRRTSCPDIVQLRQLTHWCNIPEPVKQRQNLSGCEAAVLLTKGYISLIDHEDVLGVSGFYWSVIVSGNLVYACRYVAIDSKQALKFLHRLLLSPQCQYEIDHRDYSLLEFMVIDNRRRNIRVVSRSANHANRRKISGTSSEFKGVTWDKHKGKWKAAIGFNGMHKFLGLFSNQLDAAMAYNAAHDGYYPDIPEGRNRV